MTYSASTPLSVVMVIGNGLTIDLLSQASNGLSQWHPSKPMSWNISPNVKDNGSVRSVRPLNLPMFSRFGAAIAEARAANPPASEFDLIVEATLGPRSTGNIREEARRYLAGVYSAHDDIVRQWTRIQDWEWTAWFAGIKPHLKFVVSFNYDLVAEYALRAAGVDFGRLGIHDEGGTAVPMLKPHSSIDFGVAVVPHAPSFFVLGSDFPQRWLSPEERKTWWRPECNLVLPGELSDMTGHQSVAPGYEQLKAVGATATHCVIAGISYWSVDRPEIDSILDTLSSGTTVIVADPFPPKDLVTAIETRGLRYKHWQARACLPFERGTW